MSPNLRIAPRISGRPRPLFFASGYWRPKCMRQGRHMREEPVLLWRPQVEASIGSSSWPPYAEDIQGLVEQKFTDQLTSQSQKQHSKKAFLVRLQMASSKQKWMPGFPHFLFLAYLQLGPLCLSWEASPCVWGRSEAAGSQKHALIYSKLLHRLSRVEGLHDITPLHLPPCHSHFFFNHQMAKPELKWLLLQGWTSPGGQSCGPTLKQPGNNWDGHIWF